MTLDLRVQTVPELVHDKKLWSKVFPVRRLFIIAVVLSLFSILLLTSRGGSSVTLQIILTVGMIRLWIAVVELILRKRIYLRHLDCKQSLQLDMQLNDDCVDLKSEGYRGRVEYFLAREYTVLPEYMIARFPMISAVTGTPCKWFGPSGYLSDKTVRQFIVKRLKARGHSTNLSKLEVTDLPLGEAILGFERNLFLRDLREPLYTMCRMAQLNLASVHIFLFSIGIAAMFALNNDNLFWVSGVFVMLFLLRPYLHPRLVRFAFSLNPVISMCRMTFFEEGYEFISNAGTFRANYCAFSSYRCTQSVVELFGPMSDQAVSYINRSSLDLPEHWQQLDSLLARKLPKREVQLTPTE